jgi:hypothetical protein
MKLAVYQSLKENYTMKKNVIKQSVLAMTVVMASVYMSTASAHTITSTVAAGKTDSVNFQCFADTDLSTAADGTTSALDAQQVYVDVTAGTVTATLGHIDMVTPANQDWTGQASTSGAGVLLTPPAGKTAGIWSSKGYILSISNSTASTQTYTVNFHCQRTGGAHTGTGAKITSGTADPLIDTTVVIDF